MQRSEAYARWHTDATAAQAKDHHRPDVEAQIAAELAEDAADGGADEDTE